MSLYNSTKGSQFEEIFNNSIQAELYGVKVYMALAHLAKQQGLDDAAKVFHHIAVQEGEHAGMYAVANGEVNESFWNMVKQIQALEEAADDNLSARAEELKEAGFIDASNEVARIAKEEKAHGLLLADLLKKYNK
ncbi:ferritin family protein [uncultured Veillonella sp.]|uniref:ferritin family protein n=1 Tax=uncultured Veillonella sp. TaxID=159268 RepID=UPI0025F4604B|nr:ferritin family protein [uncultured Veillonella sp.]MDY3974397.1 ferritin family protein [Veillonella caviae]